MWISRLRYEMLLADNVRTDAALESASNAAIHERDARHQEREFNKEVIAHHINVERELRERLIEAEGRARAAEATAQMYQIQWNQLQRERGELLRKVVPDLPVTVPQVHDARMVVEPLNSNTFEHQDRAHAGGMDGETLLPLEETGLREERTGAAMFEDPDEQPDRELHDHLMARGVVIRAPQPPPER